MCDRLYTKAEKLEPTYTGSHTTTPHHIQARCQSATTDVHQNSTEGYVQAETTCSVSCDVVSTLLADSGARSCGSLQHPNNKETSLSLGWRCHDLGSRMRGATKMVVALRRLAKATHALWMFVEGRVGLLNMIRRTEQLHVGG